MKRNVIVIFAHALLSFEIWPIKKYIFSHIYNTAPRLSSNLSLIYICMHSGIQSSIRDQTRCFNYLAEPVQEIPYIKQFSKLATIMRAVCIHISICIC
jgi:hypothetical protein